jgi:hypothetical protein
MALGAARGDAADYTSAAEVFAAIARLEAEVDGRLLALDRASPAARAFVASVRHDRARHRAERARLRGRLGLPPAGREAAASASDASLEGLRTRQQALVHAHAEGLPALGRREAVDALAVHMVDLARQLAVIDLWIEMEEQSG